MSVGLRLAALCAISPDGLMAQEAFKLEGLDLRWVAPGTFIEGADGDAKNPSRLTQVKDGFWIACTEITQKFYEAIAKTNPSVQKGADHPVENVTWHEAVAFAKLLTERARSLPGFPAEHVFRLPTATEWEYAARGGSQSGKSVFAGGDKLEEIGWGRDESPRVHQPVRRKRPNELGLYDMTGNVWEWCLDSLPPDRTGKPNESTKIKRGGSFNNSGAASHVTNYGEMDPQQKGQRFGFRLVLAKSGPGLP